MGSIFFFYDNETFLLLAAPMYFREDNGYQRNSTWSLPFCGKSKLLGKKVLFLQLLIVWCPNWTSRTQKSVTTKPCQDKVGEFFKNAA